MVDDLRDLKVPLPSRRSATAEVVKVKSQKPKLKKESIPDGLLSFLCYLDKIDAGAIFK